MTKFIARWFELFKPYLEMIQDPFIRDVSTVAVPLFGGFLLVWLISLPFGLASELIQALVAISSVPAG